MPKKKFQQWLSHSDQGRFRKAASFFGDFSHDPNIWRINRRSVVRAIAIGLFTAFMPIPVQMLLAAALAIAFAAYLPVALILVWITNPVTMPVFFYWAYHLGAYLLDMPAEPIQVEMSFNWLFTQLLHRWQPFLVGCLCAGALAGGIGATVVNLYWRYHVSKEWKKRSLLRKFKGKK
ncbi:MAG: DUF2062 domain-containing protein [Gammaproteobacteria bacterium]|nr:DUF2062 domain-containing protein [Gammaproteobacteria bacterium]